MHRAADAGAVTVAGGENQAEQIREVTDGRGVDAVFDFVGVAPTIKVAMSVVALQGQVTVLGIAGGKYEWDFYSTPYEAQLTNTYWGTIEDLHEVVDLYKAGLISPLVTRYSLDDALEAYRALQAGELDGRAVVVPHSS